MIRRAALLALAATTLLRAEEPSLFTWYLTNDFLFQVNDLGARKANPWGPVAEEDKRPNQLQDSLTLFGSYSLGRYGEVSAGTTLRSTNFYRQDQNITLEKRDDSIHRWFARYRVGGFELQAGDFFALLGQGMVLSVVQNDALLRERTITGGDARWRTDRIDVRALSGTVRTEVRTEGKQQAWSVSAAEAGVEYLKGHRAGVRTSRIEDTKVPLYSVKYGRRDTHSFSLAGVNLFGVLSYYGEYGRLFYRDEADLRLGRQPGNAVYGNLTLRLKHVLIVAEHKKYERFDNGLNNLPLADREEELNDLKYQEGTRLFAQYHMRNPDISIFAGIGSYAEGEAMPGRDRPKGHNVYGGFNLQDLWDCFSASYSYGLRNVGYPVKKSNASATYQFAQDWSVEGTFKDKRYEQSLHRFHEQDLNLQLAKAAWGAVWVLKQHSRDPVPDLGGGRDFYSGGVRVNLRNGAYVELSGGRMRGGEVCSGGQCVVLPPFKGWKLAAHVTFK